jgi:hypothetical protein
MLIPLNETFDRRVQWVARRIEHVMLRQAVNLREKQSCFQLGVSPPRLAHLPPQLLVNLTDPAFEQWLETREHFALHADAVRQLSSAITSALA